MFGNVGADRLETVSGITGKRGETPTERGRCGHDERVQGGRIGTTTATMHRANCRRLSMPLLRRVGGACDRRVSIDVRRRSIEHRRRAVDVDANVGRVHRNRRTECDVAVVVDDETGRRSVDDWFG